MQWGCKISLKMLKIPTKSTLTILFEMGGGVQSSPQAPVAKTGTFYTEKDRI